jgi:hypothetical protein
MIDAGAKLRGRIDQVTPERVHGWAFDEHGPERQIDVSVFVDGRKVAQLRCDRPRPDLLALGTFRSVGHGFEHRFQPPLALVPPRRVTLRFLESGRILERGDAMLPPDAKPTAPDFGHSLPAAYPVLPSPRLPRDWFRLLGLLDEAQGLYNLVAQCDWTDRRPDQVVYGVMGRQADAVAGHDWDAGRARDLAHETLIAPAFQRAVRDLLLAAFPEKSRRFFIHVPKCAGTDLSAHLAARFPAIHQSLGDPAYTPRAALFRSLAALVRLLPWFDFILVHGHINLGDVLESGLLRPTDTMFTTLRPPIDIALSQTNYILTRILRDAERGAFGPDSRDWLAALGLEVGPGDVSRTMLMDLRLPLLRDTAINQPDTICTWLGGGAADAVTDRLVRLGAEVTTTRHYSAWLVRRWGITARTRRNESDPFLTREELAPADLDHLHDITVEDRRRYEGVEKRIIDAGAVSVVLGRGDGG